MTGETSPDLARFVQDWAALWQEECQAQMADPEGLAGMMALWRAATTAWTDAPAVRSGESARAPGAQAAAAASDAGDGEVERGARGDDKRVARGGDKRVARGDDKRGAGGEIERLARRVEALEARLAKLDTARRHRG